MNQNRKYAMCKYLMMLAAALLAATETIDMSDVRADPWPRHTIDDTSRGADGVRLADVNGDGRLDIVTGWEEGGVVRVYLAPEPRSVRRPWPAIQVGNVASPEDAVFADVDADGHLDVVSCCEGKTRSVFVHWNPGTLSGEDWATEAFPQLLGRLPWMFCLPLTDDQQQLTELVIGSKGGTGEIGILEPPDRGSRKTLADWTWKVLGQAGWIMSIQSADIDGDGLEDIVYSDRRESTRGVHWFRRPSDKSQSWLHSTLGGRDREVMFLSIGDIDGDSHRDVVASARHPQMLILRQLDGAGQQWDSRDVPYPPSVGTGKGIATGDIDGDGVPDLVCTCEQAREVSGVFWMSRGSNVTDPGWEFHDISGTDEGVKFDRLELIDLDNDGDLDVLTCEERDGLGVIWYENRLN